MGLTGLAPRHTHFVNAMREVRRRFDEVEVDRLRVKPK